MAKAFHRFIEKQDKGAKKKERIRQEKKLIRQETKEFFAKKKAEAKQYWEQKKEKSQPSGEHPRSKDQKPAPRRSAPLTSETRPVPIKKSTGKSAPVGTRMKEADESKSPSKVTTMPLNKYIAHSGICSRRDAAEMVRTGKVKVNNEVVSEPGFKVSDKDEVRINGKKINITRNLVYILLNKKLFLLNFILCSKIILLSLYAIS